MAEGFKTHESVELDKEVLVKAFDEALSDLLERSQNNPVLYGALSLFVDALTNRANYGDSTKDLSPEVQAGLVKALRDSAEKVNYDSIGIAERDPMRNASK